MSELDDSSKKTLWAEIRTTFVRGFVLIIPLALTIWFFRALLNAIDGILSPVLETWIGRPIPGLGFISMVVIILLVGLLSRNLVGRLLFSWFENVVRSIPFVRSVYSAIRDLVNAFAMGSKGRTFREVVLIQYPRQGIYSVGFVTNEMQFAGREEQRVDLVNVYIVNPANPTSGMLIFVPKQDVIHLNISVEQGLKLALSGGIVTPDRLEARAGLS
jgi:uncharacterized membrane protein